MLVSQINLIESLYLKQALTVNMHVCAEQCLGGADLWSEGAALQVYLQCKKKKKKILTAKCQSYD